VAGALKTIRERDHERVAVVDDGTEGAQNVEMWVDFADAEGAAFAVGVNRDFAEAV
jgi:hypothetical protein